MPKLRVAGYIRVSSEEQTEGFSLDAQRRAIEKWTADHNGELVKVYLDDSSGRTLKRPAFAALRHDAGKGKFDAVAVHKWDRFARSREDSLAVKSLLRLNYGLTVHSCTESGQDDTDGAFGMLIEGLFELLAEWYSVNLASEVSKALSEKHEQGYHLTRPPLGYDMVKKELVVNEQESAAVRCAFELFATGKYSYLTLTEALNERGYRTKKGARLSRDTIRALLVNRTYIGQVSHARVKYNTDGSRKRRQPPNWQLARHTPIIDKALFDAVQEVLRGRQIRRGTKADYKPNMLRGLVYCHYCRFIDRPDGPLPPAWSRMFHRAHSQHGGRYFVCARDLRGHGKCKQKPVQAADLEATVIELLTDQLKIGDDWRQRAIAAIAARHGGQDIQKRLAELLDKAARMDQRFDLGFIQLESYRAERSAAQDEINTLKALLTIDSEIEEAADVLNNFSKHWIARNGDPEAQNELLRKILCAVYVKDRDQIGLEFTNAYQYLITLPKETSSVTTVESQEWIRRDLNP